MIYDYSQRPVAHVHSFPISACLADAVGNVTLTLQPLEARGVADMMQDARQWWGGTGGVWRGWGWQGALSSVAVDLLQQYSPFRKLEWNGVFL